MQSSPRNGSKVRLLAIHTTEGIARVGDLVAFFNRKDAVGSCHASADATGALWGPERGFVPYDHAAWTIRNGNPVSDNLEYCGWAKTTRAQWLSTEAKGLDAIALWLADRSRARGIPLVKLSPADVKAGKSGVIGHVDWTQGMNDGTHWDPGPGFPFDVVLDKARWLLNPTPVEEDVPYRDWPQADKDALMADLSRNVWNRTPPDGTGAWPWHRLNGVDAKTGSTDTKVDALTAAVADLAKVVAALKP